MKKVKLFYPHMELRIFVTDEMEKDYIECGEMAEQFGTGKDCNTCSWNDADIEGMPICTLQRVAEQILIKKEINI